MKRPQLLESVDLKKLRAYLDESGGDGWTIWQPQKFTDMGFKADDLPFELHESGTGKYQITNSETGEVSDVQGVWNLSFLILLAHSLDLKPAGFMGRGFQARECTRLITPVIDAMRIKEEQ